MRPGLAYAISDAFYGERLDLSARQAPGQGWAAMPEVAQAQRLREHGASPAEVRFFITFTAAMDRARDAGRLWTRSGDLFLGQRQMFDPDRVVEFQRGELDRALRESGVSQRHSLDAWAWRTIATSIAANASPEVSAAIAHGNGDAQVLLRATRRRNSGGEALFPMLAGPKVGPMWVRMLSMPGEANLQNLSSLPVSVDVHVRRVTENLGMAATHGRELDAIRRTIQAAWTADVHNHGSAGPAPLSNTCAGLDPAIWFVGKWGCSYCERSGTRLRVAEFCQACTFTPEADGGRSLASW